MRIVSLLPSATEIVCGLGLEDRLVGVTHECDHPPTVRGKTRVTRTLIPPDAPSREIDRLVRQQRDSGAALYQLDFEAMQRLEPDLIVTQTLCDVCAVDDYEVRKFVGQVTKSGKPPPRVVYLEPQRLDDVLESIMQVAAAAGVPERGRSFVLRLRQRIERVRAAATEARTATSRGSHGLGERVRVDYVSGRGGTSGAASAGRPPESASLAHAGTPRVVVLEWLDPLFSCGHWTPELVEIAGGVEPLARAGERSREVSPEELAAADPDLILIACCGFTGERTMQDVTPFLQDASVRRLHCTQEGRVYVVDGSAYFSRPGPRLVDGLEILAHALDPATHALPEGLPAAVRITP